MSKTKSLEIECASVNINANYRQRLLVSIEDPSGIDEILNGIDENDMNEWIANNRNPDDVFVTADLEKWAVENGYTKE
jgi:hypothetical protein